MPHLDQLKLAIHRSNELVQADKYREALGVLDEAISAAVKENHARWIRILCHHAAVIAQSHADLPRAQRYYERSLASDPEDPMALYGLAKVAYEQGRHDVAQDYAERCYAAVTHSDDPITHGILDLLVHRLPDIGGGQGH